MKNNDSWVLVLLIGFILLLIAQIFKVNWLFAFSFPAIIFVWMWIGASKKGKVRGSLKIGLISLLIVYWLGYYIMFRYDMSAVEGIILGFSKPTAIQLLVVWLIPLFSLTILFGIRFKKDFLTDNDIKEFNEKTGCTIPMDIREKEEDNIKA